MKIILSLVLLIIAMVITGLSMRARPIARTQSANEIVTEVKQIPTKDMILANAQWGIENPEILDARLLFSEEANKAVGAGIVYEGEFYKPDDPVWVVVVKSRTAAVQMPDIGQGNEKYAGILWVLDAADGQAITMASIKDPDKDSRLARLKELPDRDGTIEIIPRASPPITTPEPTATAIPKAIPGDQ